MANPVVHFEILAEDGVGLQKFYVDTFGWSIDADNAMNYGMIDNAGEGIGGGIGPGEASGVTIYIEVADLAAALEQVTAVGGKVVAPPMAVPDGPEISTFSDPAGNVVGMVKAMGG